MKLQYCIIDLSKRRIEYIYYREREQVQPLHRIRGPTPSQVSNFVDSRALERRAEAVDDASVVLCCLSNDFIDNKFCELEVQYAYRLKKKMVFMQMQENYKPKGWIGMVIGVGEIINMHDNFLRGFNLSKLVRFIDACEQDMIL